MSLPSFSVNNRVLVNMMMLVILVAGTIFAFTLVREMFPETRPNKLLIVAVHPGVQPEEIEKAVTIKIEEAVRNVEGIEKVESSVREGFSTTTLTLLSDVDNVDVTLQEVKNEIDAIQDLPDDIEKVTVKKSEPRLPVISVAFFGDGDIDEKAMKRAARSLRDELLTLPGISDVEITGTRDDEISIEVRPERMLEYDITFDEIAAAIRETNLDVSGGELKGERASVAVRTLGEENSGDELEDLVVRTNPDGRRILLSDVADIHDRLVDTDVVSYFNSMPSVSCVVYKTKTQDAIQIATLVKAFVRGKTGEPFDAYGFHAASERPWYRKPFDLTGAGLTWLVTKLTDRADPADIYEQSGKFPFDHNDQVALHTDLARFVEGRLDLMTRNGMTGLILVLISLNLFLNWRVAFWATIGLPVSFVGTFIVMWALGVSINLLSLFGLIIVLGIIVDDAIVIGENIYRHVDEGMPPKEAAIKGAEEVMWPVTIAVLTTIAAFAPMLFIRGRMGDFFKELPIVVLAALTVSLIEALVILPAHLCHLPKRKEKSGQAVKPERKRGLLRRAFSAFQRFQENTIQGLLPDMYERCLRVLLRWRYVTLAVAVATWIVSIGMLAGDIVERVFIQKMDSESLICFLDMPVGSTTEQLQVPMKQLTDHVVTVPEVTNVQSMVGFQVDVGGDGTVGLNLQPHLGQVMIELKAADLRQRNNERSSEELLAELRAVSRELPALNSITWQAMSGGPGGKAIKIQVSGKHFEDLIAVAGELRKELAKFDGVESLDDDYDTGKREVRLRLRDAARPTGITVEILGMHVRSALFGHEAKRLTRNREDVKIMVRYPKSFRENIYNLESMWIPTSARAGERGWVPLSEVAELEETDAYTTIHRSQQQRAVTVLGDVNDDVVDTFEVLASVRQAFDTRISQEYPGVRIEFLGSFEERTKAFDGLWNGFFVALLIIYTMLAGLFRSYVQPIVVMCAIPFAIEGAIFGHWLTNHPMTILSGIGMVALTGIVVNDSLVLVDFVNKKIRAGLSFFEANIQGARLRLRPILLTTLTTVAGLTPLMFETSFQAKFLIPMAVTLTFGLMFATALTLIIVPALNLVFFDIRSIALRAWTGKETLDDDPGE